MKINISKYILEYIFGWFLFLFELRVQDKHAVNKNTQTESKSNFLQIDDSSYLHSLEKEKIFDKSLTTNHGYTRRLVDFCTECNSQNEQSPPAVGGQSWPRLVSPLTPLPNRSLITPVRLLLPYHLRSFCLPLALLEWTWLE
jgi:hypothetical protein